MTFKNKKLYSFSKELIEKNSKSWYMSKELIWCQRFCNADPYKIRNESANNLCYFLTGWICDWSGNHGDQKSARPTMLTNLSRFWPINTTYVHFHKRWRLISDFWMRMAVRTKSYEIRIDFFCCFFDEDNHVFLKFMYLLEQIAISINKIRID